MMESAPTTEAVYEGVYTLYNNRNTVEQERASKWLEQLQNSVSLYLNGKRHEFWKQKDKISCCDEKSVEDGFIKGKQTT